MTRWKIAFFLLAWTVAGSTPLLRAESDDERFVEGLRRRRLYELAEAFCQQRLASPEISDRQVAELTIQRMRTLSQQALELPRDQRQAVWDQAVAVADQFQRQHANNPRILMVRIQAALILLAQGEVAVQEAQLDVDPDNAYQMARDSLRQAIRELGDAPDRIGKVLSSTRSGDAEADALTDLELIGLRNNVYLQLARAYRWQALGYPADSDDRVNSLTQAIQALQKPLTQIDAADPLIWQIRVEQLIDHRWLGNLAKARQFAVTLQQEAAPADVRQLARAEAARVELAAGNAPRALELLAGPESQQSDSAELDYARLETAVAMWQAANQKQDANAARTWRERAVALVESIEKQHGPYWGRRGEQLLVQTAGADGAGGNVEVLARTADNLYRRQRLDEAVDAYSQAGATAMQLDQRTIAFELLYKAALIEHQRERYRVASRRFLELAKQLSSVPQAEKAHLMGIVDAAQVARQNPQELNLYVAGLVEHLRIWPDASTANQVRIWLAMVRETERDWKTALGLYQSVPFDTDLGAKAVQGSQRCWLALLQDNSTGNTRQEQARQAAEYFERIVLGDHNRLPRQWTDPQRLAATAAGRIRLTYTPKAYQAAESLLSSAVDNNPQADARWRTETRMLLLVALAAQPEQQAMLREQWNRIDWTATDQAMVLATIAQANMVLDQADNNVRPGLAQLLLDLIDRALEQDASATQPDRAPLLRSRALALVTLGRRDEALTELARLARSSPRDLVVQQQYARLLGDGRDRPSMLRALDQWRIVAKGLRPHTEPWYQAKIEVVQLQTRLGQPKEAAQLIRYLLATAPDLAGTPLESQLKALLREVDSTP